MLEGLLPGLVNARHTLAVLLAENEGGGTGRIQRYFSEWLQNDEVRLGCSQEAALFSMSRAVHKFSDENFIGMPLALCPTCCRTGAGRLRVIFVRSPIARLRSFFRGYWGPRKGHLLLQGTGFKEWIEIILSPEARNNRSLFEASDFDHVAPALSAPIGDVTDNRTVIFSLDNVAASQLRVEAALCAPPFRHCSPLPLFPVHEAGTSTRHHRRDRVDAGGVLSGGDELSLPASTIALIESYYSHDLAALRLSEWE
eukprot:TRINITY_DN34739_c0_g2_i1.p1 TRINITY_DN34739_c0_g2~~TRINITY_DN34739_c0_g2_i1.p1  ORF type:complete len:294 (-),score=31.45 TRINITY_DN34739_c0_g2_i1:56-820(-)